MKKSSWYTTNAFKIGAGLCAVLLIVILLVTIQKITTTQSSSAVTVSGETQIIAMDANSYGYEPTTFTVEAGKPVKWSIDGSNAVGCAQYLIAPKLGISKKLEKGENIFEFTPEKGTYEFSCSMGMFRGVITAV